MCGYQISPSTTWVLETELSKGSPSTLNAAACCRVIEKPPRKITELVLVRRLHSCSEWSRMEQQSLVSFVCCYDRKHLRAP